MAEAFTRRNFIGGLALVGAAAAVPATAARAQAAPPVAAGAPAVETWQLIGKDVFTGNAGRNWARVPSSVLFGFACLQFAFARQAKLASD